MASMVPESPRILFVTDHCAGSTAGYGLRVANTVGGLRQVGSVTVVFLVRDVDDNQWPDQDVTIIPAQEVLSRTAYLTTALAGRPRDGAYRNRHRLIGQLRGLVRDHDLVWLFRARPFDAIGPIIDDGHDRPPLVVDFDDLYDDFHRQQAIGRGVGGLARVGASALLSWQWKGYQRRIANTAARVLVTHEADRTRLAGLGFDNVSVLPNGYPPTRPAARPAERCTLIFVGGHHYGPNAVAAQQLGNEILPLVRAEIPDAELILVGRPGPGTEQLARQPGVRYLGFVDDLDGAFDDATVVCTPIRTGSGSRLKVLEAMARKVPLVSTEFGCHGFDLVDGHHYLRAERSCETAEAVVRLHRDRALADRLVSVAYDHYQTRFDRPAVEARTADIAAGVLNGRSQHQALGARQGR